MWALRDKDNSNATVFQLRRRALAAMLESDAALHQAWDKRLEASQPRGIIISAGNKGPIVNAFVVVYVLRHALNCTLPVTLLYYGASELGLGTVPLFRAHDLRVDFVDSSASGYPAHHQPVLEAGAQRPQSKELGKELGYKIKIAALYQAPYREVFFLDSDCLPLQDVTSLFDLPEYREHGSL